MVQSSIQLTTEEKEKRRTIERVRTCIADLQDLDVYSIYNKDDYQAKITPLEKRIDIIINQIFKYGEKKYFEYISLDNLNYPDSRDGPSRYDDKVTDSRGWVS